MFVNETMANVMCFGRITEIRVSYNCVPVQQVSQYKYLGNILKSETEPTLFASQ